MKLSVVIPCYRSASTLAGVVEPLLATLQAITTEHEVILVVDGSPDDTYAVARGLERAHPGQVRALLLRRNYGQHNAILAGLFRARHAITVTMDDDGQHLPEEIPALLAPLADDMVDLVYGVPVQEEHGFARSLASRVVKAGLAAAEVPSARDVSAFRAFRTDLRDGFAHVADPFANIDVLLSWTTTQVRKAEVRMSTRTEGKSGYSLSKLARHAMNMVTGYGTVPLRVVTYLGLLSSLLGVVLLVAVLVGYFTGRTSVAGFTTLASMLAIMSGAIMLSLGILGEYLGRLHFRSMQRPTYLIRVDGQSTGPRAGLPGVQLPQVQEHPDPDAVALAVEHRAVARRTDS